MYQHVQPAHERPPLHRTTYLASEPPEGGSRVGSAGPDMLSSRITPTITRVRLVVRCRLGRGFTAGIRAWVLGHGEQMCGTNEQLVLRTSLFGVHLTRPLPESTECTAVQLLLGVSYGCAKNDLF